MSNSVEYQQSGSVAVITLNDLPVNSLGLDLRTRLLELFRSAVADSSVTSILITGTGRMFCAGADISEFDNGKALTSPLIPEVFNEIDACPKPVVAGVNGAALGGGLELALACDYRYAHPDAKLGLPEVNLGIIPGAGGTQRLPRVTNLKVAMDVILTGKPIKAGKAERLGIVDRIATGSDFLTGAIEYTRVQTVSKNSSDQIVDFKGNDRSHLEDMLKSLHPVREQSKLACAKALDIACTHNLEDGLKMEWALFKECHESPQSRALQHLFFAQRQATKVPGLEKTTLPRAIKSVAVIGAGLMGGGIAMNFANAGIPVKMLEVKKPALEKGLASIQSVYESAVRKEKMSHSQAEMCNSLISGTLDYQDLADVDLVIEAVFESMDVKRQVFSRLDEVCKPGCILASNTSTLDLNEIAAVTKRPQDVVGLHFFSPAHIMKLLEIVRGKETSNEALATALQVSRLIGKQPVVVGVCYGFVGNRMVAPYSREAFRMVLEGAAPEQVDQVLTEFGMAMGVISMGDMAGIDVGCAAAEANADEWKGDPSYQALQFKLKELGRLGQKTGHGVYIYQGREKINDPETITLSVELAEKHNIERREIGQDEIRKRCMYALINEGARVLEEGIANRSSDIDLIYTNGYGFPSWRGGPMQYADEIGLARVVAGLNHYRESLGEYGELWFKPAPLLERLAKEGKSFKDFQP
ncbi:3-hydroxyacyl-CoA dehydrogenase NAD-binding domain-containing protein [Endozoicomonas arenosclerae]|uniref:3-hydroxyacyl-CoA dehydrogenase NAD-binding domain-containing protein n=1 Tax=Endozoicomonas arenosclerae TaxID=1633495 RepID=UPI000782B81F|nr:3-hydroxyacyl-CoA dehydrogenase NAD-binding domain-containing protein [Endozoicomonas arenosclerae]